jgi:hypothetical protein
MRRTLWIAVPLLLIAGLGAVAGGVYWMGTRPPEFYAKALRTTAEEPVRRADSKRFVQSVVRLVEEIRHESRWSAEFPVETVNAWLADELPRKYAGWIPKRVENPRIGIDGDRLLVGARLTGGVWSGVLSGRVRPWLAGPNQLALEIESISAGLLPVPVDSLLEEVVNKARKQDWDIRWKQVAGHDVLMIDLAPHIGRDLIVSEVGLVDGKLILSGHREQLATLEDAGSRPR